jgi:hypothetical protein
VIALNTLSIDRELKPSQLKRSITAHETDHSITLVYESTSIRLLRTAVHSALESLALVVRTMDAFDPQ